MRPEPHKNAPYLAMNASNEQATTPTSYPPHNLKHTKTKMAVMAFMNILHSSFLLARSDACAGEIVDEILADLCIYAAFTGTRMENGDS